MTGPAALLLQGLYVTMTVTALGALVAAVTGFGAGIMRVSNDPIVRGSARLYVEVFRGTSALVQLFWLYYALPLVFDIDVSAMTAAVVVLGLNTGAYAAEVVRSSLLGVARTQDEAAQALGLSTGHSLRHVILPQALPVMLPPLSNLLVELLKASSLVSLITLTDITFAADLIRADTLRTGAVYGGVLVIYFVLAQGMTLGMQAIERRVGRFRNAELSQ